MKPRLLAFDLDGTFLAPDKSVTPRARRAVEALREQGVEPVPTTGRDYQTLFDKVLGMDGLRYAVAANGAVVLDAVPEGATAGGVPARVVRINGEKVPAKPPRHPCDDMDQIHVADPVSMELCRLRGEMERLEKRLQEVEKAGPTEASL